MYSPIKYVFQAIKETYNAKKEKVHVFEEEPCLWKRVLFNKAGNQLYVSMYRRPTEQYAKHLKKYKNLKKVFVELPQHKQLLIECGIDEEKIEVTPTPSKIERKKSNKEYSSDNVNILFASWNNKEGDAIKERGLEYLLELLKENPNYTLTIPLRDNDTKNFNAIAKEKGVYDRVKLLEIHNNTQILTQLFDDSDFVAFVPQKRVVKDVPNSLIDGLVRGKPVIISDVIDFSQEVKQYGMGIVIPGGEKAKRINIDKETYRELSKRAYEYSERNSNENYLSIIQNSYDLKKKEKNLKDRIKIDPKKGNRQLPKK